MLKDKIVLITGSCIGIGKATALELSKQKASIVITYLKDEKDAKTTAEQCLQNGAAEVLVKQLDIRDNNSIKKCINAVLEKFGKISILINNAGVVECKEFADQSIDEIDNQIQTNLKGTIMVTKLCLPHIEEMIINIASGAGKSAYVGLSTYCATKFAIRGFTLSIAKEMKNLKIHVVNPGMTATRMTDYRGVSPEIIADTILKVIEKRPNLVDIDV